MLTNPIVVSAIGPSNYAGDIDRNRNRCPIIEGFAWPLSVNIGQPISFYVSTTSPSYSLSIFRLGWYNGLGGRAVSGQWTGLTVGASSNPQPEPVNGGDATDWMPVLLEGSSTFTIPLSWTSGYFVVKLQEVTTSKQSYIFFVVRDDFRHSDLIVQSSVSTFVQYNGWGGGSSGYSYNNLNDITTLNTSFLRRPFLPSSSPACNYGTGAGHIFCHDKGAGGDATWNPDRPLAAEYGCCDAWEYNFVRWIENNGYDVTYCTNYDTHNNQFLLANHYVWVSIGHDELVSSSIQ